MIDPALCHKLWSEANLDPTYLAELERICLPGQQTKKKGSLADLPAIFCKLQGGTEYQVIPIVSAWTILRYAARILDDIEDNDVKQEDARLAINLNNSTGLIFTAGLALNECEIYDIPVEAARAIRQTFYRELLTVCAGQHCDLSQNMPSLAESWQIAGAKSGTFLGLICWAGGRINCDDGSVLERYRQFGYNLGVLDQIRDDLADLWAGETHFSDLYRSGNGGLPLAYALAVLPEELRNRLLFYLEGNNKTPEHEEAAQKIIVESGAGAYLAVQSVHLYQQSRQLLEQMELPEVTFHKLSIFLDQARLPTVDV